jgi:hypothetical protein
LTPRYCQVSLLQRDLENDRRGPTTSWDAASVQQRVGLETSGNATAGRSFRKLCLLLDSVF